MCLSRLAQTITLLAMFFCCQLFAHSEPKSEDKLTADPQTMIPNKIEAPKLSSPKNRIASFLKDKFGFLEKYTQADDENERTLDFSLNGNKMTQNLSTIVTVPINPIDGYARGQFFFMRHERMLEAPKQETDTTVNTDTTKETDIVLSRSYMLQLEGNIAPRVHDIFALRGHFEIENDPTIETDPHLHFSVFGEIGKPKSWIKGGLGGWSEFDQENKDGRYGWRIHADVEFDYKGINFSTEIEFLPQIPWGKYSIRTSPEIKVDIRDEWLSFVLVGEIDYYSDRDYINIEPLLDVFSPWDTSVTHLWTVTFD